MARKQATRKKVLSKKTTVKGKTRLKQAPRVEKVKVLLLIALAALIGGFSVWLTRASSPYQYSLTSCKQPSGVEINFVNGMMTGATQELKKFKTCIDQSSEAMAYRLYVGLAARQPETLSIPPKPTDGLIYWSNQIAKSSPERVTQRMLCTKELYKLGLTGYENIGCNVQLAKLGYKQKNNQEFVDWLYKNMLGKSEEKKNGDYLYDPSGRAYWKQQLDQNKKKRHQVITAFAKSGEAKNRNLASFTIYAANQYKHQIAK